MLLVKNSYRVGSKEDISADSKKTGDWKINELIYFTTNVPSKMTLEEIESAEKKRIRNDQAEGMN